MISTHLRQREISSNIFSTDIVYIGQKQMSQYQCSAIYTVHKYIESVCTKVYQPKVDVPVSVFCIGETMDPIPQKAPYRHFCAVLFPYLSLILFLESNMVPWYHICFHLVFWHIYIALKQIGQFFFFLFLHSFQSTYLCFVESYHIV